MSPKLHEFLVTLYRRDENTPWGIRLVGGSDLNAPLIITKVYTTTTHTEDAFLCKNLHCDSFDLNQTTLINWYNHLVPMKTRVNEKRYFEEQWQASQWFTFIYLKCMQFDERLPKKKTETYRKMICATFYGVCDRVKFWNNKQIVLFIMKKCCFSLDLL